MTFLNIRFSEKAKTDLDWFRRYYGQAFPEGEKTASVQFRKAIRLIKQHWQIGHPLPEYGLRELSITKTPFSIIYGAFNGELIIVRVFDQRAQRPIDWAS
ncbi:MAG: type II toxin-antitoxin system RelE/ParE family toxin [Beijerinckiaceae bacterium]